MPGLKRKASSVSPVAAKRVKFGDGAPTTPIPTGPGGPMEIVFSFDTTGSMSSCLVQVRKNLTDMINRLQKDIPGLRMAVFAHGDYCDAHNYVTKYVDFTNDVTKLVDFVNNVSSTGGGDVDECYELVLHEVRTKLSWSAGTQRSLVMIGDANPHGPKYPQNTLKLDWKKETEKLSAEGVHIYGVNCGNSYCEDFYKSIASKTDGKYLELKDWNNIFDMMMAICYREHGVEFFKAYEHEVRSRGPAVSREMDVMLKALRHRDDSDDESDSAKPSSTTSGPAAVPIAPTPKRKLATVTKKRPISKTSGTKPGTVKTSPRIKGVTKPTKLRYRNRERYAKQPFSSLDWSRWHRLITKTKPNHRLAKNWIPTRNGVIGFRSIGLFKADAAKPAFYEVAVKAGWRKMYTTYFSVTNGFNFTSHLDTCLFRSRSGRLNTQINDVIKKNCSVYVRRAELPKKVTLEGTPLTGTTEVRDFVKKHLDYAWNNSNRVSHRLVMARDIMISNDKL